MESRNPVFGRSREFARSGGGYATFDTRTPSAGELREMYDTRRMTMDDVVMKTATLFGILLVAAAAVFIPVYRGIDEVTGQPPAYAFPLLLVGALVGLGLSLWAQLSKKIRPGVMMAYAVAEGVFVGAISAIFERFYDGIVIQAVLGTLGAFIAMLVLYRTGVIRATPKFTKILLIAGAGYLVFGLLNLVLSLATGTNLYTASGPLGLLLAAFGVGLASLFLVLDFDYVDQGIKNGLPEQYAWRAAFGLVVTLVWIYIEILRLLAILRGDN